MVGVLNGLYIGSHAKRLNNVVSVLMVHVQVSYRGVGPGISPPRI